MLPAMIRSSGEAASEIEELTLIPGCPASPAPRGTRVRLLLRMICTLRHTEGCVRVRAGRVRQQNLTNESAIKFIQQ